MMWLRKLVLVLALSVFCVSALAVHSANAQTAAPPAGGDTANNELPYIRGSADGSLTPTTTGADLAFSRALSVPCGARFTTNFFTLWLPDNEGVSVGGTTYNSLNTAAPARMCFHDRTGTPITTATLTCPGATVNQGAGTISLADGGSCNLTAVAAAGTGGELISYTTTVSRTGFVYTVSAGTATGETFGGTVGGDTIPPTAAITGVPAVTDGATAFTATFTFSEDVDGFDLADINAALGNATASAFATVTASTVFTALITPNGAGDVTVGVNAGAAQDAAGNDNTAAPTQTATLDNTAPTVAITGVPAATDGATAFTATFTFSEDVTDFDLADINAALGNATASAFATVTASTVFTALITPNGAGDVTVGVNAGAAQDAAGNDNTAAPTQTAILDNTAPTVAVTGVPATTDGATAFTATFTFSEDVAGFDLTDINAALGNATASAFATVTADTVFTALITPSGAGDVTVGVNAGAAQDAAGNDNTAAATQTATLDTAGPTVAVTGVPAVTDGATAFTATFTFSEDVDGFDLADVNAALGNATASAFATVTASTVFTALITPNGAGDVTVSVNADAAQDAAGNDNVAAATQTATLDNAAPTVAITGVPAVTDGATAFTVTVTFSEDVDGFALADVNAALGNATASAFATVTASTVFTALITPNGAGDVTVGVNAGAAQDAAGNDNTAAPTQTATLDDAAPTLTITAPADARGPFTATFTFSEDVIGFALGDIAVGNGTPSGLVAVSGSEFTATITPGAQGAVTIDVPAGAAQDAAGNDNTAAAQASVNFIDEALVRTRTQSIISNFISRRADQITANDPDLTGRLGNGSGGDTTGVNFVATGTDANLNLEFATSVRQLITARKAREVTPEYEVLALAAADPNAASEPPADSFDFWTQGTWTHVDGDTRDTDIGQLYFGLDYRMDSSLVVGVLTQFDWTDEDDATQGFSADGFGWLAGPYVVARLSEHLIFDARAAWGTSDNNVSPFNTFTDSFDTERWLVRGTLTGQFDIDGWFLAPQAGIIYFKEKQKSYTDSLGVFIPSQTISLGRVTFGPKIYTHYSGLDDVVVSPYFGIKGLWDFERPVTRNIATGLASDSSDDVRGRVEGGLMLNLPEGLSISGDGFYDGIGADNFEAYGGRVRLIVPLQ